MATIGEEPQKRRYWILPAWKREDRSSVWADLEAWLLGPHLWPLDADLDGRAYPRAGDLVCFYVAKHAIPKRAHGREAAWGVCYKARVTSAVPYRLSEDVQARLRATTPPFDPGCYFISLDDIEPIWPTVHEDSVKGQLQAPRGLRADHTWKWRQATVNPLCEEDYRLLTT